MSSIGKIVELTTKIAPNGIGWENFRRSENVEDHRLESLKTVLEVATDTDKLMNFYATHGALKTYNLVVYAMNNEIEPSDAVLEAVNKEIVDAAQKELDTGQTVYPERRVPLPKKKPKKNPAS